MKMSPIFTSVVLFCGALAISGNVDKNTPALFTCYASNESASVVEKVDVKAFNKAVIKNQVKVVKEYILAGGDVNVKYADGFTPLMVAVRKGHVEIVRLLIVGGADVNARDKWGRTALISAVREENLELVRILLASGADVNARSNAGVTALREAMGQNEEIETLLKQAGAKE